MRRGALLTPLLVFAAACGQPAATTTTPGSTASPSQSPSGPWSLAGTMFADRQGHTATLLTNGAVLVVGGAWLDSAPVAELYDPSANRWLVVSHQPAESRSRHTATLLPNGKVLMAGGQVATGVGSRAVLNTAILYDPVQGTWTPAAGMHAPRENHVAVLLRTGLLLVIGGDAGTGALNTTELYDATTNTWTVAGTLTLPRTAFTATLLNDGRVLVAGGSTLYGPLTNAEIFDPSTNRWTAVARMLQGRAGHAATALADGRVLVAGGELTTGDSIGLAEIYDPGADRWSAVAPMAVQRSQQTASLLANGTVLVAGGNSRGAYVSSTEVFDPKRNSWTAAGWMPIGRYGHAATTLSDGKVLITGGVVDGGTKSAVTPVSLRRSAAVFDPRLLANWQPASPASPTPSSIEVQVSLLDVAFADSLLGWVVGTRCGEGCGMAVFTATDGTTWHDRDVTPIRDALGVAIATSQPSLSVRLGSANDVYLFAGSAILASHDGGTTWQRAAQGGTVVDLVASGPWNAWALVTRPDHCCVPVLITTADGGRTWHDAVPQPPLRLAGAQMGRVATTTWILSEGTLSEGQSTVLFLKDGTTTWVAHTTPCAFGRSGQALAAADPAHLWLECGDQPASSYLQTKHLYRSSDGGATWSEVAEPGTGGNIGGLAAPGGNTLIATATCGSLRRSGDGGLTWTTAISMGDTGGDGCEGPIRIAFPDPFNGWAAGGARVYRTSDGGVHWTATTLGRTSQ